jgi:mannose-6-phosphate isomerase
MEIDYSELDSFVVLIGLKGECTLTIDGEEVTFHAGESILIPATAKEVRTEGTMKFLETYVLS